MRAQATLEWIIILSLALFVLAVMLSMNQDNLRFFQTNVKAGNIKSTLNDLKNSADFVYSQGSGARSRLFLNIPAASNFTVSTVEGGKGLIRASINISGSYEVFDVYTEANLTGSLPQAAGGYCVDVVCLGEVVSITRSEGSCSGYK